MVGFLKMRLQKRRLIPLIGIILSVIVLGSVIYCARLYLAKTIRNQITNRDADILYSAICLLRDTATDEFNGTISDISDPTEQFNLLLKASHLRGVIAIRLFDKNGAFINAIPASVKEVDLSSDELIPIKSLKSIARFHQNLALSEIFYFIPDSLKEKRTEFPILEVNIPLHRKGETKLLGSAQFFIQGESIAKEFAALDKTLNLQALIAFGVSSLIIVLGLGYAFQKLEERTVSLQKANQQLAMTARISALGAITAHLIHGLKSPLAGLQLLATDKSANGDSTSDWENVSKSINRMRNMINDVISLLREEDSTLSYQISTSELAEMVSAKTSSLAKESGVNFSIECNCKASLTNREANLINLILINLIENAIQATPAGKKVILKIEKANGSIIFNVIDEGNGLPSSMLNDPFVPCHSSKPGGSGIGLAISKQLANHIGAQLLLKYSSKNGTCFQLNITPTKI